MSLSKPSITIVVEPLETTAPAPVEPPAAPPPEPVEPAAKP